MAWFSRTERPKIGKTHCKNGHPYTPENIYKNGKNGSYCCKQCKFASDDKLLDDHYERYEKRREYQRQYQRNHPRKPAHRIKEILDYVKAAKTSCIYCNESHPACLDFHHRDPLEKSFGMARAHLCLRSLEAVKHEITKCDIICSNCHRKLHSRESEG